MKLLVGLLLSSFCLGLIISVRGDDVTDDETVTDEVPSSSKSRERDDTTAVVPEKTSDQGSDVIKRLSSKLMFVDPPLGGRSSGIGLEIPGNRLIKVLISTENIQDLGADTGTLELKAIDAAFRYPTDYSYYLQNFTVSKFSRSLAPKQQASLAYTFTPSQQLVGHPFGFTLRLHYQNTFNEPWVHVVFNDTVQVVEADEGFDTEAFFLWLLVIALAMLVLFGIYQILRAQKFSSFSKSSRSFKTKTHVNGNSGVEIGTVNSKLADDDLAWIPTEHLKLRNSPTSSPRGKKNRKGDVSDKKNL